MTEELKNELFKRIQEYLKPKPLIVWGSGATIPFRMPSMDDLKIKLNIQKDGNLEEILSKASKKDREQYEKEIFNIINKNDDDFRVDLHENILSIEHINILIRYFYNAHPELINIITTNYDCILEYILSYYKLPFSDGFLGKEFSQFDESNFKAKKHINLFKVHGSLRWCQGRYSHHNSDMDAIFPSKKKYKQASQEPFRTIIAQADNAINAAACFLCIGFGFNDEHITPKIEGALQKNKPIVIVTKKATESIEKKLTSASKYVLIEESDQGGTNFRYKDVNLEKNVQLDGNYWELEQFNKIIKGEKNGR